MHRLLLIFAAHNVEELLGLERDLARLAPLFERWGVDPGLYRRDRVVVAMALLTGAAAAAAEVGLRGDGAWRGGLAVSAGALGGNAVTHGMRAALQRSYNGGLATAPLLLAAACRVGRAASRDGLGPAATRRWALAGALGAFPLIGSALRAARSARP